MKKIKAVLLLITSISIILCVFISGCTDDTSNVSDQSVVIEGKEAVYSTITDAINNAVNGDTILVGAGLYNESLIINKSITLVGDGKETTIISGNLTGDVIYVSVNYVTITGFTIQNAGTELYSKGTDAGIDIRSDYNTISDSAIKSNGNFGLYLHTVSNNNTITNNIFSENKYGINLNNGYKNNISSNTISSNTLYGIYLGSQSNNNLISDNIISNNDNYGIRIKGSETNTLSRNLFINNLRGLYFCCGANNNIVYGNIFMNNSQWNADDSLNNQWDDGTQGNYWDDYNGSDADGDGIGDTPYHISDGKNEDRYPLMKAS